MAIDRDLAANTIRTIIAQKRNDKGKNILLKSKLIFSNDQYAEDPFTCWWILINKPETPKAIVTAELGKMVFSTALGALAHASHLTHTVHEVYDTAKKWADFAGAGKKATEPANKVVKSVAYHAAEGTNNEFTFGLDHLLACGSAAFAEDGNDVYVAVKEFDAAGMASAKATLLSFMTQAAKKRQDEAINYVREVSHGDRNFHKYSTVTRRLETSNVFGSTVAGVNFHLA